MAQLNSKLRLTLLITLFVLGQMTTTNSCALKQDLPNSPFLVRLGLANNPNLGMVYNPSSHIVRINWFRGHGHEHFEVIYNNDRTVSFRSAFLGELLTYEAEPQAQSKVFFSAPSSPFSVNQRFLLINEIDGLSIRCKENNTLALGV